MATFIKRLATEDETRDWTQEELVELWANNHSKFLTVTESHAADVLRPQGRYQEVNADELAAMVQPKQSDEASDSPAKPPRKKKQSRSRNSSGSTGNGR